MAASFDLLHTLTSESIHINPTVLLDLYNGVSGRKFGEIQFTSGLKADIFFGRCL